MVRSLQHRDRREVRAPASLSPERVRRGGVLLAAGFVLVVAIALLDLTVFPDIFTYFPGQEQPQGHWVWVRNSVPSLGVAGLVRIAAVAAAAGLLLAGGMQLVRVRAEEVADGEQRRLPLAALIVALAAITTLVLAVSPAVYSTLAAEDSWVENLSAGAFVGAAIYVTVAAIRDRRRLPLLALIGLGVLALGFVFMAGEEISWGQRAIGFETPQAIAERNWQDEVNLHNFYSAHFNISSYAGSALVLVLAHWVRRAVGWPRPHSVLGAFVPGVATAVAAAPSAAMNYPTFNLLAILLPLWLVLGALLIGALSSDPRRPFTEVPKALLWATAAVIVISQVVYLARGAQFLDVARVGIASEYREFFVALAFLVYVLGVVSRLRTWTGERSGRSRTVA